MTTREAKPLSVSHRIATGAGWIIAWRVATRISGGSTLILVRLLQPADFGLVALASGIISSIDALSAIGVQDALVRAPDLDRELYDTGFGLSLLRGILTALLIALIAWPAARFFGDDRLIVVMLALSAGTVISAFENIGIIDFRRDVAFRKEFDMQLWSRVVSSAMTIGVAVVWRSYWALIAGILTYRLVRLFQSYAMSPYRPRVTFRAWRRIIGFSLWTWAGMILSQIQERSDSIIIGRLLGPCRWACFAVGWNWVRCRRRKSSSRWGALCSPALRRCIMLPMVWQTMFLGAVGIAFMLVLPAGVGISMVADPMVRLCLGEQWLAAVPVVQIMAIGAIVAVFIHAAANLINAIGRPRVTFFTGLVFHPCEGIGPVAPGAAGRPAGRGGRLVGSSLINVVVLLWYALPRAGVSPSQLLAS